MRIPPLLEGWINELKDPKTPDHVKMNRCLMLEELQKAITAATMTYRSKAALELNSNPKRGMRL